MEGNRHTVTELLRDLDTGDPVQADRLMELVYVELRRLAGAQMRNERADHTLRPTELVHEAYVRLVGDGAPGWDSRAHFFGTAARAMRQILVDHARRRDAGKRGGDLTRVTLSATVAGGEAAGGLVDILDLQRSLEALEARDPEVARLVELRFFAGLTVDEAAQALGISPRKAAKDWAAARLWLQRDLSE